MAKQSVFLQVKPYKKGYGVTDGMFWFHYYYETETAAEKIMSNINTAERRRVNVASNCPIELIKG